ncbi:MAG: IS66 family insertion sequence element accessory protein TnpB [Treponema sp.]|uniref:hypothetical protein n=1 Tax=Treponema sp. TaxID=166 RepID=UPI00298E4A9F|nr:hypothetical protein [Treponema sp.]MCQ2602138.1 IS66 family insertion sequence element accessory protein TnpB [Treponema sp.]
MDQSTHDVRYNTWLDIIKQCQRRPQNITAKQWLSENDIDEKRYYYWLRKFRKEAYDQLQLPAVSSSVSNDVSFAEISYSADTPSFQCTTEQDHNSSKPVAVIKCNSFSIELSNEISESLLSRLLQEVNHA